MQYTTQKGFFSNLYSFLKSIDFKKFFAFWVFNTCLAWLWWLSYMTITGKASNDVSEIKMSLIALMTACVYYFFGSSSQSQAKDAAISKALDSTPGKTEIKVENVENVNTDKS